MATGVGKIEDLYKKPEHWNDEAIFGYGSSRFPSVGGGGGGSVNYDVGGNGGHTVEYPGPNLSANHVLLRMVASRLRVPEGSVIPFDHIYCAQHEDKVAVFVMNEGEHVVIEDGADLFPSDQLITQLRLIARK